MLFAGNAAEERANNDEDDSENDATDGEGEDFGGEKIGKTGFGGSGASVGSDLVEISHVIHKSIITQEIKNRQSRSGDRSGPLGQVLSRQNGFACS